MKTDWNWTISECEICVWAKISLNLKYNKETVLKHLSWGWSFLSLYCHLPSTFLKPGGDMINNKLSPIESLIQGDSFSSNLFMENLAKRLLIKWKRCNRASQYREQISRQTQTVVWCYFLLTRFLFWGQASTDHY